MQVVKLKLASDVIVEAERGSRLHETFLRLGAREVDARGHRKAKRDDPGEVREDHTDAGKGYLQPAAEVVAEQAPEGTVSTD
jgi:hypothetical protein